MMETDAPPLREAEYFPVSTTKLVILSVLTFGLYELYWFWKNWRFVKDRDSSNILPWGRALFGVFWYPVLLNDLNRSSQTGRPFRGAIVVVLSISYFLLHVCGGLPDPLWLISLFAFIPLFPAVREINRRNPAPNSAYDRHSAWKLRHALLALIVLPLLAFGVASSLLLIPSAEVVPGILFWGPGRVFVEENVLEDGEEVEFYYSDALLSFRADGNILTSERAISYWEDENGEFYVIGARFAEIDEVGVDPGSWLEPMTVTVHRKDGDAFDLYLPAGDDRSSHFVERLHELIRSHALPNLPDATQTAE